MSAKTEADYQAGRADGEREAREQLAADPQADMMTTPVKRGTSISYQAGYRVGRSAVRNEWWNARQNGGQS